MARYVWGALFGIACLLAAFILYIVFARYDDFDPESRPAYLMKGFVLAGGILMVGLYPLLKMRQRGRTPEPRAAPSPEAELLAGIKDEDGDDNPRSQ